MKRPSTLNGQFKLTEDSKGTPMLTVTSVNQISIFKTSIFKTSIFKTSIFKPVAA